jgi:hypothetical protein
MDSHTVLKEIKKRGAHNDLGRCPVGQSREDLT